MFDRFMLLASMLALAAAMAEEGASERAIRIVASSEEHAARIGIVFPPAVYQLLGGSLDAARASLSAEVAEGAATAGRAMTIEAAIAYALEAPLVPI